MVKCVFVIGKLDDFKEFSTFEIIKSIDFVTKIPHFVGGIARLVGGIARLAL